MEIGTKTGLEKQVPVWVSVTGKGVDVVPETVRLSKSAQQEAIWRCNHGQLEIRFKEDTPFRGRRFESPIEGGCCSGVAVVDPSEIKSYKYMVIVTTPDGHTHSVDPDVKVDS